MYKVQIVMDREERVGWMEVIEEGEKGIDLVEE